MNYTKLRIREAFENLRNRIKNINTYQSPFIMPGTGYNHADIVGTVGFDDVFTSDLSKSTADNAICQADRSIIGKQIENTVTIASPFCHEGVQFSPLSAGVYSRAMQYIDLSKIKYMSFQKKKPQLVIGPVFSLLCPENLYAPTYFTNLIKDSSGAQYDIRLLQLPGFINNYLSTMFEIQGGNTKVKHIVVPTSCTIRSIYLQYLIVEEDCMRELAESIPDKSSSSSTWKIQIGATNLANLSKETINLFEQKGWTLS